MKDSYMKNINEVIKEMVGKPMTAEQKRCLEELRRKVKTEKLTVEQARKEWAKLREA